MAVEDVLFIRGRGAVATGTVGAGEVTAGMAIVAYRSGVAVGTLRATGAEMFRKNVPGASAGQNVGLLLSATDRDMAGGDESGAARRGDELVAR